MKQNDELSFPDAFPDFELDFDLDDFNLSGEAEENVRVMRPRLDENSVRREVTFENARAFANQIELTPGARTFAFVSGAFVFGDLPEALAYERGVSIKRLYVATLSISQENIDSFHNLLKFGGVEDMRLLISGYFYSHEKFGLVPYLYDQLDVDEKLQVAFGNYHQKIIAIETQSGNTIVLHGSANLRSSSSIEQVMCEVNNAELYDFVAAYIKHQTEAYKTINHGVKARRISTKEQKALWQAAVSSLKLGNTK